MRRFVIVLLCVCNLTLTFAATPIWVRHIPTADNDNYRYVVESAVGTTEDIAYNRAMGLVLQHAIMPLGLTFNSAQVDDAIKLGQIESMMTTFKIPINKVCTYREKYKNGSVRVYVLCQVAVAGNIEVKFTTYSYCGSDGDDIEINMRPEEWNIYESNRYFSSSVEEELERGQSEISLKTTLEAQAKQNLIDDIGLTDSVLIAAIAKQSSYDKMSKVGYAIAYLEKERVINQYSVKIEDDLDTTDKLLKNARSYINENNLVNAKAILERVDSILEDVENKLNFLWVYSTSRSVERNLQDCRTMRSQMKTLSLETAGNSQKMSENKIHEYIRNGMYAIYRENKLGDGLRYLFGAQVLLADLPNRNTFVVNVPDPQTDQMTSVGAFTFISQQIKNVLEGVQISFDGFLPESDVEAKLSFRFKGQAVTNLNYIYNSGNGWSPDNLPVKDGWSIISMQAKNHPSSIRVQIEYRYADEAAFDPDLQIKMAKYGNTYNYNDFAVHIVPVIERTAAEFIKTPTSVNKKPSGFATSTSMTQNVVADKVEQTIHKVSSADSVKYQIIIDKVCQAITSKDYESAYSCFTEDGYDQFERLMKYGKARIIYKNKCHYLRIGDYIMCRSIPMAFSFTKGKQAIENVVFSFNGDKIDGIQFGLEESSASDIMTDNRCGETEKLILINFMENYKTAFALKRIDYIASIFADDAVIITGRAAKQTDVVDGQQIMTNEYIFTQQSKDEYIKRLSRSFQSKEWISIKFGKTKVEKTSQDYYGVCLLQDYASSNYGDRGYLFLLIDIVDLDKPLIRVRSWQPETGTSKPMDANEYSKLTEGFYN